MDVVDIWEKLHIVFDGKEDDENGQPEIEVSPLKADEMAACLLYLLRQSRDCTTQFVIAGTKMVVYLASPHAVVKNIIEANVTCAIWFNLPFMPPVGAYIDAPDSINLSYIRGTWNAMSLLMFFDLLQTLKAFVPSIQIKASAYSFTKAERQLFAEVWQDYANALL